MQVESGVSSPFADLSPVKMQAKPSSHQDNRSRPIACNPSTNGARAAFDHKRNTSLSPTKMPTLSDIAARMKIETASDSPYGSPTKHNSAEGRPRLDLTGRLNNSSSTAVVADTDGAYKTATLVPSSPTKLYASREATAIESGMSSGASSPTKRMASNGLPTLDEIRDRMAKKGLSITSPELSTSDTEASSSDSVQGSKSLQPSLNKSNALHTVLEQQVPIAQPKHLLPISNTEINPFKSDMPPPLSPGKVVTFTKETKLGDDKPSPFSPTAQARRQAAPSPSTLPFSSPGKPSLVKVYPLQHVWTLFFDSKNGNLGSMPSTPAVTPKLTPELAMNALVSPASPMWPTTPSASSLVSWEANLKNLGTYDAVETFLATFSTLHRPSQLDRNANYHLFKDGIKPMWEDPRNAHGGKWCLTFKQSNPALLDRSWMWLVLGLIGEQLDDHDQVTGAVCSVRHRGDRIALWLRDKGNIDRVNYLGRKLLQLLGLEREPGISLEFSYNNGVPVEKPSKYISVHNPSSSVNLTANWTPQQQAQPNWQAQPIYMGKSLSNPSNAIGPLLSIQQPTIQAYGMMPTSSGKVHFVKHLVPPASPSQADSGPKSGSFAQHRQGNRPAGLFGREAQSPSNPSLGLSLGLSLSPNGNHSPSQSKFGTSQPHRGVGAARFGGAGAGGILNRVGTEPSDNTSCSSRSASNDSSDVISRTTSSATTSPSVSSKAEL